MQFIKTDANVDLAENIVETTSQTVTHLVIPAGKTVPKHHVPYDVIVVPIKGKVIFGDVDHDHHETLVPGDIVKMAPGEWHDLKAVDDTEVMVIKSKLQ
ncbi:cupin domain-containing protein [Limosilactobacillus avium]|jgi:quercetin dioxygenase-like cupin family protein|uniref:cupin n=1 Tax=Limosilactobacillus avium TaxID=2991831 RepID=UPI0024B87BFD|nr:cupin [Limosilactobacillus avium]